MKKILPLLMVILPLLSISQVSESEFQALKALYNATDGDNWTNKTGWETINTTATKDSVTSEWHAVSIYSGQLKRLELWSNNLVGTIPEEIGNLVNLTALFLSNNQLSGSIPDSIGNLINLSTFQAYHNQLTGSLPKTIGNLDFLSEFNLSNNQISGILPTSIDSLPRLSSISLSSNNLEGSLPKLTESANLSNISVHENNFTGEIPAEWINLTRLWKINIRNNKIHGSIQGKVPWDALQDFYINNNNFTFFSFEPIKEEILKLNPRDYATQNKVLVNQKEISVDAESPLSLNAQTLTDLDLGGANNRYRWEKDGTELVSGNNPTYHVASSSIADAGIYKCFVTNTELPEVELELEAITVIIVGGNNLPTDITLSHDTISENRANKLVGTLSTTDADTDDTHSYSLVEGDGENDIDNPYFTINGNELSLKSAKNYEYKQQLFINIKTDDGKGGIFTKAFIINILDVNEAPNIEGQQTTIDETAPAGTVVFTLTASDPENDAITFSIAGGNTSGAFTITGSEVLVKTANLLDYETAKADTLQIEATDGSLSNEAQFIVKLNQIDEPPVVEDHVFNIDENSAVNSKVGTITASDPEAATLYYTINYGNDDAFFKLAGNELQIAKAIDFESNSIFNLVINVSDGISTLPSNVTVNINNLADETGNDLLSVTFDGMVGTPEINATTKTVKAIIAGNEHPINAVKLNFTVSKAASSNLSTGTTLDFTTAQNIIVTSETGNSVTWNVSIGFPDNVQNFDAVKFKIYPSPAVDFINIETNATIQKITINSIKSEVIRIANPTSNAIAISHLTPGIYFMSIQTNNETVVKRFIKQ